MATEKLSAYSAQANVLTTELNSLADGARSAPSAEINNGTGLNRFAEAELIVDFGTNPTANAPIDLYMIVAPDGTNYSDGNATIGAAQALWVGSFHVRASTETQRLMTRRFELRPGKIKFLVQNGTGQAFVSSGNILNLYTYNRTIS